MIHPNYRSVFLRDPHKDDFLLFEEYVNRKPNFTLVNLQPSLIKGTYKKVYYLNMLVSKLSHNITALNFIKESKSDLIMALELCNMNYIKPFKMALRSCIEQFNRFLLMENHSLQSEMSVREINETSKRLYDVGSVEHRIISSLLSDYRSLCKYVHVEDNDHFNPKLVLSNFEDFNMKEVNNFIKELNRITENLTVLLIRLFLDTYSKINSYDRILIEDSLSPRFRELIVG